MDQDPCAHCSYQRQLSHVSHSDSDDQDQPEEEVPWDLLRPRGFPARRCYHRLVLLGCPRSMKLNIFCLSNTVLCEALGWGEKGVAILGEVHARGGGQFLANPIAKRNLNYLKDTTSTALYAHIPSMIFQNTYTLFW